MQLIHTRKQHPVGQGFFHSGNVSVDGKTFNYLYDCGSDYAQPLNSAVTSYIEGLDSQLIDILFLSHLHFDHVSGLDRLLVLARVKTAVLPYLAPHSRLLLIAEAMDRGILNSSYLQLLSDPTGWFAERGVERIIYVAPADPPPEEPPEWMMPDEPGPYSPRETNEEEPKWPDKRRMIDEGGLYLDTWSLSDDTNGLRGHSRKNSSRVQTISCLQPLRILTPTCRWLNWQFVTFVHPEGTREETFLCEVRQKFPRLIPRNKFELSTARMLDILQNASEREKLASCYAVVRKDLNLTSLSVYSGPVTMTNIEHRYAALFGGHYWLNPADRIAWIGTGDANLKGKRRHKAFVTHFASVQEHVSTFSLPHHGSRHNFAPDLKAFGAFFVAAAGSNNKYGHPHPEVELLFQPYGNLQLWKTTESPLTVIVERVVLNSPK